MLDSAVLRAQARARHHGIVFWTRDPVLTRAEMNGVILLLMSIDAHLRRIARAAGDENGEEEEE